MSLTNIHLLPNLYDGLSSPDTSSPTSPCLSVHDQMLFGADDNAPRSPTTCLDGMALDDNPDPLTAQPSKPIALRSPLSPFHSRHPSFSGFSPVPRSPMHRLSSTSIGLFGNSYADSLSRTKGGELPVLEHLLSTDGARTLSLGKCCIPTFARAVLTFESFRQHSMRITSTRARKVKRTR